MAKRLTFIIIISIGILVFSGCAKKPAVNQNTNSTPTPTPTATPVPEIDTNNWKTYRNEEYGFEIKYPNDWKTEKVDLYDANIPNFHISPLNPGDPPKDPYYAPLSITIFDKDKNLTIEEWFVIEYPLNKDDLKNFQFYKINGADAADWYDKDSVIPDHSYYISRGDKIYIFSLMDAQQDIEKANLMMRTIVFTFKFMSK